MNEHPFHLALSVDERTTLESWVASPHAPGKRALRASIVLVAAEGRDAREIARRLCIRPSTATKWLRRFVLERIAGLDDRPRSGAPRRITQERIAELVQMTLEPTPKQARRWSRRSMAHATGLSRSTVHRVWNAFGIAPKAPTGAQ